MNDATRFELVPSVWQISNTPRIRPIPKKAMKTRVWSGESPAIRPTGAAMAWRANAEKRNPAIAPAVDPERTPTKTGSITLIPRIYTMIQRNLSRNPVFILPLSIGNTDSSNLL